MTQLTREELAERYFEQLPYDPYPVQEEALLAWFSSDQGVLVCAPTGMGKTLIAEAALFEALHDGSVAYYTTPLIALTEQKFREMQEAAVRWGFRAEDVGLVTGNRRENPEARILVVVAEILFNRLLHPDDFHFDQTSAVVMDEFHSFNDPERGIVWEFSLGLLPRHVRTLLLSATVGNAVDFLRWLRINHQRDLELVHSEERKVPLTFQWVGDQLLTEHVEWMAEGNEEGRTTPALVFCFNRSQCWDIADQLRGKRLIDDRQREALLEVLPQYDLSHGAGPKLRQLLQRGVGVHHAGVLPKFRRVVEDLFQQKLLSVSVCTETLAAGINLPARSVVLPELVKGPRDRRRLIDPSSAHQMFGRAGRPQFDAQGYVFVLAHEDDVKIARYKEKMEQIPDDTKDPQLIKKKKQLKKKMPRRREGETYWTEEQFIKLRNSPPGNLVSRGYLPWRLLAHMLDASPDVEPIRRLVAQRLLSGKGLEQAQRDLEEKLMTLWRAGYVELEPPPPPEALQIERSVESAVDRQQSSWEFTADTAEKDGSGEGEREDYRPRRAVPTDELAKLTLFRSVNPLFGVFLVKLLGVADPHERLQAMESVLEFPRSVGPAVRVPGYEELPHGALARERLDPLLLQLGLALPDQLTGETPQEEGEEDAQADRRRRQRRGFVEERPRVYCLAEKLELLFKYEYPTVRDARIYPVWVAGEMLEFGGDFEKYISSKGLQRQEGIVFRHLLRMILLLGEFSQLAPAELDGDAWREELRETADRITECCRRVDPLSTEKALEQVETSEEEE